MYRQLILAGCAVMATTLPLSAQDRFALVIGNAAYQSLPPLPQAQQDASSVAEGLTELGFDVDLVLNANLRFQRFSVQQYAEKLSQAAPGSVGVVYYQGHGVALDGINYLLPPTVAADNAGAVARTSIDLATLVTAPGADVQSTVIMDCCVANPFAATSGISGQGFAEVTAPDGVLLAYAAPLGEVATGDGSFAADLLAQLALPDLSVVDAVVATAPQYISNGLPELVEDVAEPEPAADELAWNEVKESGDSAALAAFVENFPESGYAATAQDLITALDAATEEEQVAEATEGETTETPPVEDAADVAATEEAEATEEAVEDAVAVEEASSGAGDAAEVAEGAAPDAEPETEEAEAASDGPVAGDDTEVAEAVVAEDTAPESPAVEEQDMAEIAARIAETEVSFSVPLAAGAAGVADFTIEDLIAGTAMYPPIEGLPDELWKEQTCAGCHEWNPTNLCEQATFYLSDAGAENLSKQHPYGGSFKLNLAQWARGGCQ